MWDFSGLPALTLVWGPTCAMPSLGFSGSVKSDFRVFICKEEIFSGWRGFFLLPHTVVFLL